MAHECPDCGEICYCDGEDHLQDVSLHCSHQCDENPMENDELFDRGSPLEMLARMLSVCIVVADSLNIYATQAGVSDDLDITGTLTGLKIRDRWLRRSSDLPGGIRASKGWRRHIRRQKARGLITTSRG